MTRDSISICLTVLLGCCVGTAEEPLHTNIDRLIVARFGGEPAPPAGDAAFFRRVNLDLAGRIPSAQSTRQFLDDPSTDKRPATVDRLLSSPSYVDRMTNLLHETLMERRGDDGDWERFLRGCFEQNKPWDQIVREILNPNREDETLRGAAYFYAKRLEKVGQNPTDFPGLTRDVGRLFLGTDLQCAECHNHLFIDDYKQHDFQGLLAVYKNVSIRKEDFPAINESTMTSKFEFVSVFEADIKSTGPRIPFGKEFDVPEPMPEDPAKKKKKPDPNEPPSFSALGLIAEELPNRESRLFRQNIVNRLWFIMMGQGLVEPLDQFHSANPPTHPELLQWLADEFAANHWDIKWMIRELALTQTYQRSSQMYSDGDLPPRESYRLGNQRRLSAEQLFWSVLQATGNLNQLAPQHDAEPSEAFNELQTRFVSAFAGEPKEPAIEYAPAVKQALFLLNDQSVLDLLEPREGNLIERLSRMTDEKIADELFLSIFCRFPCDEERAVVEDYLKSNPENKMAAVRRLAWGMLSSMEFCVNH